MIRVVSVPALIEVPLGVLEHLEPDRIGVAFF
jgi:hypothetical protein